MQRRQTKSTNKFNSTNKKMAYENKSIFLWFENNLLNKNNQRISCVWHSSSYIILCDVVWFGIHLFLLDDGECICLHGHFWAMQHQTNGCVTTSVGYWMVVWEPWYAEVGNQLHTQVFCIANTGFVYLIHQCHSLITYRESCGVCFSKMRCVICKWTPAAFVITKLCTPVVSRPIISYQIF
jgi:hypothetical protein